MPFSGINQCPSLYYLKKKKKGNFFHFFQFLFGYLQNVKNVQTAFIEILWKFINSINKGRSSVKLED